MRESALQHLVAPGPAAGEPSLSMEAFRHEGEHVLEGVLRARDGRCWWIEGGVPRLLGAGMYRSPVLEVRYARELRRLGLGPPGAGVTSGRLHRIQSRTIDRFGAEWLAFRDWGYHAEPPNGDALEFQGGLWGNTLAAFRSKTFLGGRLDDRLVLDAGCGNGRFTAAALALGAREVIAVDIGWGVEAAFEHHKADRRVHVVQASLFELPVRAVEIAFSLGVLMHTGDAAGAFAQIARVVAPGGLFAVRMYHRGNWAYEAVDGAIRGTTTRLGKRSQLRFARAMAAVGRRIASAEARLARPGLRMRVYQVLRNWPTVHHNLDWWSAPVATHHTAPQVAAWAESAGLELVRSEPKPDGGPYGFWSWPEALTMLFARPAIALGARGGNAVSAHRPPAAVGAA
ncbi:MAG TPA: class I SAM-dependent methyltransferase [Phycisphaerales bacterium]|nr:class I SAM-dependent methyltransferase [Phycisphaerales bacterium]